MDKKHIIELKGKEFITYAGLLDEFFKQNGKEIITEEVITSNEAFPKFKATVKGEKGIFTGFGDANDTNVNSMIKLHKYRMAETRAKARALRDYCNIGMCSLEELGGEEIEDKKPYQPKELQSKVKTINEVMKTLTFVQYRKLSEEQKNKVKDYIMKETEQPFVSEEEIEYFLNK